jgi:hypothetical protein
MQPIREMTSDSAYNAVMGKRNMISTSKSTKDFLADVSSTDQSVSDESPRHSSSSATKIRPVNERDFAVALKKVKKSGDDARNYWRRQNSSSSTMEACSNVSGASEQNILKGINMDELMRGAHILQRLMQSLDLNPDGSKYSNDFSIPDISEEK